VIGISGSSWMEVFAEFNILADLSQERALLLVEKKAG
jgi:hypothetical protein